MTALLGRMVPLLSRFLTSRLAARGIANLDPRLGRFVQSALSAGYTSDAIIDYLRGRVSGDVPEGTRPDEMASVATDPSAVKKSISTGIGIAFGIGGARDGGPENPPPSASEMGDEPVIGKTNLNVGDILNEHPNIASISSSMINQGLDSGTISRGLIKLGLGKEISDIERKSGTSFPQFLDMAAPFLSKQAPSPAATQKAPQAQQSGSADAQLMAMMQKLSDSLRG